MHNHCCGGNCFFCAIKPKNSAVAARADFRSGKEDETICIDMTADAGILSIVGHGIEFVYSLRICPDRYGRNSVVEEEK